MVGRRVLSLLKSRASAPGTAAEEGKAKAKSWGRKVVSGALICLTGGVALSALDDLLIFHGCSSKAMEKASNNQALIEAIGEPIVRGPWYNASLAVAHKRQSVSCSFPVSGPQGTGMFQLKAVRNGDDSWFSFVLPRDWEILIMEALLHVPGNEKKQQTFRITVSDNQPPQACKVDFPPSEPSGFSAQPPSSPPVDPPPRRSFVATLQDSPSLSPSARALKKSLGDLDKGYGSCRSLNGIPGLFFSREEISDICLPFKFTIAHEIPPLPRIRARFVKMKLRGFFQVNLLDPRIDEIWLDDESGSFTRKVVYENLPKYCTFYRHVGHECDRCFEKKLQEKQNVTVNVEAAEEGSNLVDNLEKRKNVVDVGICSVGPSNRNLELNLSYSRRFTLNALFLNGVWDSLREVASGCSIPWIIGGDFNTILNLQEGKGINPPKLKSMKEFRDMMVDRGLIDADFENDFCTWYRDNLAKT
ncbi:hypothetical protein BUALT_Bualt01G0127600 [Buddleja alternifolia]|uniref:Uncharacterized protein n=1 Tax=Buddleja alternifolia TaxID=168488 RepID=A0AAV6YAS2_9LAMI|nr:hypothetical protein BUALT_Bualt01G0127600 [Buddleja alternifolia]